MRTVKPFDSQGQYVEVHNQVFDYMMPKLRPCAFKLLMFIIRKTTGWQKDEDRIPFSQLKAGTGIKSDHTIIAAIDELLAYDFIVCERANNGIDSNLYALNFDLEIQVVNKGTAKNAGPTSVKNADSERQHVHIHEKDMDQENIQLLAQIVKIDLGGNGDQARRARALYWQYKDKLSLEQIAEMAVGEQ